MTSLRLVLLGGVLAAATGLATGDQVALRALQAEQTIQISVSVREGSRVVSDLTAGDFELTDNGVSQAVKVSALDRVPFDITLVVDTKGSSTSVASRFASDLQQITRALRQDDRLRIVRIDSFVEELRPMSRAAAPAAPLPARPNGLSALHDALVAALVRPGEADRVHLVVAVTDGLDTTSVSTADRVREVSARTDALLQIITVRASGTSGGALRPRFRDANLLILTEAAEQTGGELRGPGFLGDSDLVTSFTRTLDDVRAGYLLSYTPDKVEHAGWHELAVAVSRAPNATVRARRGYYGN